MTTDRDMARIVRSWLEPGLTTLTDDVLDAVMDQLPATPQRRPVWPLRRIYDVNPIAKFAIAAAALVVVAITGFNLLAQGGSVEVGGVAPSTSPPISPSISPSPAPTTRLLPGGDIEPGTYRANSGSGWFTLRVPDGWTGGGDQFVAFKGEPFGETTSVTLVVWPVSHVYADSCNWTGTLVETPTPSALVEALAAQQGHETAGPIETSLGGYPATRFEFSVPSDFDVSVCDSGGSDGIIRLWPDAGPNEAYGLPIAPGQTTTIYVADIDGTKQVVGAIRWEDSSEADLAELDAVVDSLQFQP